MVHYFQIIMNLIDSHNDKISTHITRILVILQSFQIGVYPSKGVLLVKNGNKVHEGKKHIQYYRSSNKQEHGKYYVYFNLKDIRR